MGKLFGTDGIRGVANIYPMDCETACNLGRAVAGHFRSSEGKAPIIIGQDTRISGDMLAQAVGAGICSAGMDVILLGVLPTPAVAYLAKAAGAAVGVVVSASHNPFSDNGIKVFNPDGSKLSDQAEDSIEDLLAAANHNSKSIAPHQIGCFRRMDDAAGRYLDFLQASISLSLSKMTIALDCANGATYQVAPELFQRMGAKVLPMFCQPDGVNINQQCGSQHPESLARSVVKNKADLGLAFDGDGDRLIAVDEKGSVLTGDQIMAVCAKDLKAKGGLKNSAVVSTVMSNMGFRLAMKQMGIHLYTAQVGDRYVMQTMVAQNAIMGGEDSGHMIFRDMHTTGDGIMTALKVVGAMRRTGQPLSELSEIMKVFPQCLINVEVKHKPAIEMVPEIVAAVDHTEKAFGEEGRVLVRYSGTHPMCRVMVEGPSHEETEKHCREIAAVVRKTLD